MSKPLILPVKLQEIRSFHFCRQWRGLPLLFGRACAWIVFTDGKAWTAARQKLNTRHEMEHQLSEAEWNFAAVPDEQVQACCLWEYGRESAFLRSVRERSAGAARLRLPFRQRFEFVERDFSKAFDHLGPTAFFFQEGIYVLGGDKHYPGVVSRFPDSWQSLPQAERSILLETAAWDAAEMEGSPGFRRSGVARTEAMPKIFKPKSMEEVFGTASIGVREYFHSGNKLRSLCPNFMYPCGLEILAVEINWGEFTNQQLLKEFTQWLKENDPPGISRPDHRGRKKISFRVKLERLGILRLLHRFRLAELPAACPKAWKHYNSPNRRWRKEASMALTHFREMFPFLPQKEAPRSWPPRIPSGRR